MVSTILYIVLAIVILMVLITVHELGHFLAGKMLGFKINEFAIGFGKALYKKTNKKGEVFSIRLIPLGGFCAFEGEDENVKTKGAFNTKAPWRRIIVLFAGVFFNFVFGVLMCIVYLMVSGYAVPQISYIPNGNPNDFQTNDIIYAVDGKHLESYVSFSDLTKKLKVGDEVVLTISRDGEMKDITVKKYEATQWYYIANSDAFPEMYLSSGETKIDYEYFKNYIESTESFEENKFYKTKFLGGDQTTTAWTEKELIEKGVIGKVSSGTTFGFVYTMHGEDYSFGDAVSKCFSFAIYLCWLILSALGGIFTGATGLADLGGTITAVSQMVEISKMGIDKFLLLIPFLSFNLAIFNALPIPALDGARIVFVAIEGIFRKPVNRNVEATIHMVGLFLLLGLVIFLDVYHFFFACRLLL